MALYTAKTTPNALASRARPSVSARPLPSPCQRVSHVAYQEANAPTNGQVSSSDVSSSTKPSQPNASTDKPLSPKGLPSNSGISVQGYSPTSLQGWSIVKQTLRDANVKLVSAQEVVFAQDRGVPVIDIRPAEQYAEGHIPGSKNVPFYQPIQGWDPVKVARRLGYALFGVLNGTEVNPNFTQEASALFDPKHGAIIYCSIGGTLEPAEGSKKGLQSRSLIAAWQLVEAGVKNVTVLKGGFKEWVGNGRPVNMLVADE